jgi:choline monooxygenase
VSIIDPDIRIARTPPAAWYRDVQVHHRVLDAVFAAYPQLIHRPALPQNPGDILPFTLLPGALDEPLLLTRDAEGQLHCLSNVCTHRSALVADRPGHARGLRCPYHGRRFDLSGRMLRAPGFERADQPPEGSEDLVRLPLQRLGPLAFTRIAGGAHGRWHPATDPHESGEATFSQWIDPVLRRIAWLNLEALVFDETCAATYEVDASWIAYCDNYLEGFHIPFVHPGLARALEPRSYRTELFAGGSLQLGVAARGEGAFELPSGHPDAGQRIAAWYFWLFPNLMLNVYPWGISLNLVVPTGPTRCRVHFDPWVLRPELWATGASADLDTVQREDEAIVASAQRGLTSRLGQRGRYSATQERAVHHFHRLLVAALDG